MSKAFPGVQALDDVSIDIKEGEILAILGENGAGKSTLMKILSGLYHPDEGQLFLNRNWFTSEMLASEVGGALEEIKLTDPRMAMRLGIGMVYQHFQLVMPFTVTENITLGREHTVGNTMLLQMESAQEEIRNISEEYGMPIDPKAIVEDLPVGLKQRVEILKQLYRRAELLILDEPTAVLTPSEVEELFKTMRQLQKAGKSLIFISHKLKESLEIADRIVVLRKGKLVGETFPDQINEKQLAEMLVGRELIGQMEREMIETDEVVLEVSDISLTDEEGLQLLDNINFTVKKHQIVGIAGVQGNGQTELLDVMVGMAQPDTGSVTYSSMYGYKLNLLEKTTLEILRSGIAYIPEDRSSQGLILDFTVKDNSWMAFHSSDENQLKPLDNLRTDVGDRESNMVQDMTNRMMLPLRLMGKLAQRIVDNYSVQTSSIDSSMRSLSGGNQQKVLVGREFSKQPTLIVASQPTRGVDIGVMEKIHQELITRRNKGSAILLISSDLDEVRRISDYLLIMYEGKIVGEGRTADLSISEISQYMTTGKYVPEKEEKA